MAHFLEEVDVVAGKSDVADLSSKSSEHHRPGAKDASVVESAKTMRTEERDRPRFLPCCPKGYYQRDPVDKETDQKDRDDCSSCRDVGGRLRNVGFSFCLLRHYQQRRETSQIQFLQSGIINVYSLMIEEKGRT